MAESVRVALSLGGNLGDVASAFDSAIDALDAAGLCEIRRSSILQTEPVDCEPGTPDFLNMAITGLWSGTPEELLVICKELEVKAGRPAEHARNASRPLDLDIILFGDLVLKLPHLEIPHPELKKRLFVLEPMVEIAPDWIFPQSDTTLKELLLKLYSE